MTDKPAPQQPLHIRQAEGLRKLADAIEANPGLSTYMRFPMRNFDAYLVSDEDQPRATLRTFHAAMTAAGADVVIKNGTNKCEIQAVFHDAFVVTMSATAAVMAGEKPNVVAYEPLVIED
jgi:hypothetical protein